MLLFHIYSFSNSCRLFPHQDGLCIMKIESCVLGYSVFIRYCLVSVKLDGERHMTAYIFSVVTHSTDFMATQNVHTIHAFVIGCG